MQGLDAFSSMSRAAVGVATTLDSAFESLLEGWSSPIERAMGRRPAAAAAVESPPGSPGESPVAASRQGRQSSGGTAGVQGLLPRVLNPQDSVDYLAELWGNRSALSSMIGPKAPSTPPPQRQKQSAWDESASGSGPEPSHSQLAVGSPAQRHDVAQAPRSSSRTTAPPASALEWDASWDDASGQSPTNVDFRGYHMARSTCSHAG